MTMPLNLTSSGSRARASSGRTWRQAIGGLFGSREQQQQQHLQNQQAAQMNNNMHPAHMAGGGGGDENMHENVMPSPEIQQALKDKKYRQQLEATLKDLVFARRLYLNHADENWQNFLDKCQAAYKFFEGKEPERGYRENFTIENYRMLFQREASAYRDDVCRGVKRIRDGMWVNGEEVKFENELVDEGFDLAARGEKLMDLVFIVDDLEMHSQLDACHATTRAVTVERFRSALRVFDQRYMVFEKNYIEALIAVEKQSRSLVQTVAELIGALSSSGQVVNQELLDHFAELNKKSRDCYNCEYSYEIMRVVLDKTLYQNKIHRRLWHLPQELLETFNDTCNYLKELLPKILRVHPKLEHNPGLVQRLEKFHDTLHNQVGPAAAPGTFSTFMGPLYWMRSPYNIYFASALLPLRVVQGACNLARCQKWCPNDEKERVLSEANATRIEQAEGESPYKRVVNYIKLEDNPMSEFCEFLDRVLPERADLDGSVDSILLIPRIFCLYVWENRDGLAQQSEAGEVKTPLGKLVHELAPELLVDLSTVICGNSLESRPMEDLVELVITSGLDTANASDVAKQLEVVSMKLQRGNANLWNSFVSVILHEEEEEEEKRARPRLPSV